MTVFTVYSQVIGETKRVKKITTDKYAAEALKDIINSTVGNDPMTAWVEDTEVDPTIEKEYDGLEIETEWDEIEVNDGLTITVNPILVCMIQEELNDKGFAVWSEGLGEDNELYICFMKKYENSKAGKSTAKAEHKRWKKQLNIAIGAIKRKFK